ncbi:hypothetical protein RB195_016497 [Necator americanus]
MGSRKFHKKYNQITKGIGKVQSSDCWEGSGRSAFKADKGREEPRHGKLWFELFSHDVALSPCLIFIDHLKKTTSETGVVMETLNNHGVPA